MDFSEFTRGRFVPCQIINYKNITIDQLCFDFRSLRYDEATHEKAIPPHLHDFFELHYIVEGEVETTVNGVTRVCGPGHFYLMTPMSMHSHATVGPSHAGWKGFALRWVIRRAESDQVNPDLEQMYLYMMNAPAAIIDDEGLAVGQDMSGILRLCQGEHSVTELMLRLVGLLWHVSIRYMRTNTRITPALPRGLDKSQNHLAASIDYINKHVGDRISASDVAQSLFVSYSHLERLYTQYLNTSVNAYILRVKMDRAIHLLMSTNDTVRDIAASVGFSSPSYFTNTFKEYFGESPKWYRIYYNKLYFVGDPSIL